MIPPFLQAIRVTGMQILLYGLVPAWALARTRWRDAGEWSFASLVVGVSSAAWLGRLCNGSGIGVGAATGIWLAAWIGAGLLMRKKRLAPAALSWDWVLVAILFLAWTVRTIHPLQTWALGQSDAYSHLGFLRDVLERGRVGNLDYPSAYAWVMAFPAWLLRGNPYWVARFGGAFFGMGLVLGTYALLAEVRGRVAGLAAAMLVAGCPVFWLLQKTGVGSFANQVGLLLIPAVLWAYVSDRRIWLTVALAALAVAVPMMLLHALILLALLMLMDRGGGRGRLALLALLALAFVLAVGLACRLPASRGMVIASMLTGRYEVVDQVGAGWSDVFRVLASDFLSIKRIGYGSWMLNGLAWASLAVFAAAAVRGWRRRDTAWRLVGAWGLLTSVNVHFGLFQFSNYQREGWSLLIAVACLGGLIFSALWRWRDRRSWRGFWGAGWTLIALAGLALPPSHALPAGQAESDVVRYLLEMDPAEIVLARNMSGFASGQGDVVRTLHPKRISEASEIPSGIEPVYFLRDRPSLFVQMSPVMRILQPALTKETEKTLRKAESDNQRLEESLSGCEVRIRKISPHLEVWQLGRKGPER